MRFIPAAPAKFFVASFLVLLATGLVSCKRDYLPKPLGYNRLDLPDPAYQLLPDTLPYRFEYSQHAKLMADSAGFHEKFWIEVFYPELKANVHVTYKRINNNRQLLKEFLDDAYTLTAKHQIKAYAINEIITVTPSGKTAVIAELEGEATEGAVVDAITALNADPSVDGVIVQMPLPPTIRLRTVIDAIDPAKDIDGIHPLNAGLLRLGYDGFLPATAHAAVEILRRSGIEIAGIDCHIGSQITDSGPYLDAMDRVLDLVQAIEAAGIRLRHIDFGGKLAQQYLERLRIMVQWRERESAALRRYLRSFASPSTTLRDSH